MTTPVSIGGIPSLQNLDGLEGEALLREISMTFKGRASNGLTSFIRTSQSIKDIKKINPRVWEFYGKEGYDSIPMHVLETLFSKINDGVVQNFKDFCKKNEDTWLNQLSPMKMQLTTTNIPECIGIMEDRLVALQQLHAVYFSVETADVVTKDRQQYDITAIHWNGGIEDQCTYLSTVERNTFTKDNLGFPTMKKVVDIYGIKNNFINTCTPRIRSKKCKQKFSKADFPLYAGNIGSLIHFYDSIVKQVFERLSHVSNCIHETIPRRFDQEITLDLMNMLSIPYSSMVEPLDDEYPQVLKKLIGLRDEISSSAELFFAYHKYVPFDIPEMYMDTWNYKLRILNMFVTYGDEFLKFIEEAKSSFKMKSSNFVDYKDLALSKVITKILSSLKEFFMETSNNELKPYLSFFYVPRLLNLRDTITESMDILKNANLPVDLLPILQRINQQLSTAAHDCKSLYIAGAFHITRGEDVLNYYKSITGEALDIELEMVKLTLLLCNIKEYSNDQTSWEEMYKSERFVNDATVMLIKVFVNSGYEIWCNFKKTQQEIKKEYSEIFKKKNIGFKYEVSSDGKSGYVCYRDEEMVKKCLSPHLSSIEQLSCDNILTVCYLTEFDSKIKDITGPNGIQGRLYIISNVIRYLSALNVNSITVYDFITETYLTHDKVKNSEQLIRVKYAISKRVGMYEDTYITLPFITSLRGR